MDHCLTQTLQDLSKLEPQPVMSLYLDLADPRIECDGRRGTSIVTLADALTAHLRAHADDETGRMLDRALARTSQYMAEHGNDLSGRGLALFYAGEPEVFAAVRLGQPVLTSVIVDHRASAEPLPETGLFVLEPGLRAPVPPGLASRLRAERRHGSRADPRRHLARLPALGEAGEVDDRLEVHAAQRAVARAPARAQP